MGAALIRSRSTTCIASTSSSRNDTNTGSRRRWSRSFLCRSQSRRHRVFYIPPAPQLATDYRYGDVRYASRAGSSCSTSSHCAMPISDKIYRPQEIEALKINNGWASSHRRRPRRRRADLSRSDAPTITVVRMDTNERPAGSDHHVRFVVVNRMVQTSVTDLDPSTVRQAHARVVEGIEQLEGNQRARSKATATFVAGAETSS